MTLAVALANSASSIPARQTPLANAPECQAYDFAALLSARARSSTTMQHDGLSLPQDEHLASTPAATSGKASHELRAVEFQETGVFGLMDVSVLVDAAGAMAAHTQQIGTSSGACIRGPHQQRPAGDHLACGVALEPAPNAAMATSGTSPQQCFQSRPPAHTFSRPPDVVAEIAPTMIGDRGRSEARAPARISIHDADRRAPFLASGQRNAVHVAITAAEHGLSIFARVGRMEPTERARLRHAAALLLAEHGHHGATVTLDADLAEAKGE